MCIISRFMAIPILIKFWALVGVWECQRDWIMMLHDNDERNVILLRGKKSNLAATVFKQ